MGTQREQGKARPKRTSRAAVRSATAKPRYQRSQDWMGPLVQGVDNVREVTVRGMGGDESLRPADSPVLWTVQVKLAHSTETGDMYHGGFVRPGPRKPYADPSDAARLEITFGHARGCDEPPRTYEIDCDLAHLDTLAETLTAALMIARREGTIPIAKGIKPWQATIGKKNGARSEIEL